ncbi:hypothetical protein EDB87DRAFT_1670251 [Lactarius vividus]|nr:hypothetical protein EDB87DRAFT_1670251 [Lactarius vividus]
MEPQKAPTSTHDYLFALAQRPERVFGCREEVPGGRETGWPGSVPLSDADVAAARATWRRLAHLIPYHCGGFYLPGSLSPDARFTAHAVLQSREFGVRHRDMQMARFVVRWAHPGDVHSDATLALTGWEHAARAPLCRHLHPFERITWECQRSARQFVFRSIFHGDLVPQTHAWEWVVAYVYGSTERWFEGLVLLVRLRDHWMRGRPDVPFPLDYGSCLSEKDAKTEALLAHTRTFVEEVDLAMNGLGSSVQVVATREV